MSSSHSRLRTEWCPSIPRELLAGAVATFALIPEVIAFSFVAGVDPQVGLFASFVIGIVIAFAGGRPAMISAAAGSVALVAAPLVHVTGCPTCWPPVCSPVSCRSSSACCASAC
jgi:SulP family sulfate permease